MIHWWWCWWWWFIDDDDGDVNDNDNNYYNEWFIIIHYSVHNLNEADVDDSALKVMPVKSTWSLWWFCFFKMVQVQINPGHGCSKHGHKIYIEPNSPVMHSCLEDCNWWLNPVLPTSRIHIEHWTVHLFNHLLPTEVLHSGFSFVWNQLFEAPFGSRTMDYGPCNRQIGLWKQAPHLNYLNSMATGAGK